VLVLALCLVNVVATEVQRQQSTGAERSPDPHASSNFRTSSFAVMALAIWNHLPSGERNTADFTSFKTGLFSADHTTWHLHLGARVSFTKITTHSAEQINNFGTA